MLCVVRLSKPNRYPSKWQIWLGQNQDLTDLINAAVDGALLLWNLMAFRLSDRLLQESLNPTKPSKPWFLRGWWWVMFFPTWSDLIGLCWVQTQLVDTYCIVMNISKSIANITRYLNTCFFTLWMIISSQLHLNPP